MPEPNTDQNYNRPPRYGFNKAGMPIFERPRTREIEAVCWGGNGRWVTCLTSVRSTKF
jgi:hypothetical protein